MGFTPEQIKGRIKSIAKQNNADARTLMRIYMMERFLERLAQSEYRDNFIIKGGILVTAMIGVAHCDQSRNGLTLSTFRDCTLKNMPAGQWRCIIGQTDTLLSVSSRTAGAP